MVVYPASEDSYLLERNIPESLEGKSVLDVGCGSGILSVTAAINGGKVTAVDVNEEALQATAELAEENDVKVETKKSNLFKKVDGKFDLIIFNPPYVDCDAEGIEGEEAWTGGKKGRKLIDRFLGAFKTYLSGNGVVLLLISSQNEMKQELKDQGWEEIDSVNLGDEELYVMKYGN